MRAITLLFALVVTIPARAAAPLPPGVQVLFGPDRQLEDRIIGLIDSADTELLFSETLITRPRIAEAIVRAFQVRRVYVAGILDSDPGVKHYTTPAYFRINGVPVVFAARPNNNKFLVINRQVVVTGSADLSRTSMTTSAENLLVVQEPSIAAEYRKAFFIEFNQGTPVPESYTTDHP